MVVYSTTLGCSRLTPEHKQDLERDEKEETRDNKKDNDGEPRNPRDSPVEETAKQTTIFFEVTHTTYNRKADEIGRQGFTCGGANLKNLHCI